MRGTSQQGAGHHELDPRLIPIMILAATGAIILAAANIGPEASTPAMRTATAAGGILIGLGMPAAFPLLSRVCARHWTTPPPRSH